MNSEDDTTAYISRLKKTAEENESVGLYKPNESIYYELINYEKDIKWYKKLKEVYGKLDRENDYWEMCKIIFEHFPEDEENTLELMRRYDGNNSSSTIIELYNETLSDEWKEHKEIREIYLNHACKHEYKTSTFQGWEKSWDEYMLVKEQDKYRFVYASGSYAFKNSFDEADLFIDDYAAVKNNGEWYFIDKDGDKYINCKGTYDKVYSFSEGYAVVVKDGKYGYIDMEGNEYHIEYDYASKLYNNVAAVKKGDKWFLINQNLELINDNYYEDVIVNSVDICSRRAFLFAKKDGKYMLLDSSGNAITEPIFDNAKLFGLDDNAAVEIDEKWGFVDTNGEIIIDCQYEDADSFSYGFAPVKIGGVYEYIYAEGGIMTKLELQNAMQLRGDGYGVISNEKGYRVITFKMCHIGKE